MGVMGARQVLEHYGLSRSALAGGFSGEGPPPWPHNLGWQPGPSHPPAGCLVALTPLSKASPLSLSKAATVAQRFSEGGR